jgi:uncharacterized protein
VLGNMMYWGGEDRILWAAGAMLVHPQVVLEAFLDFQMPDDLVQGYGYPRLTEESKRKMLGENYCRLHGLNPEEVKAAVVDDEWSRRRKADASPEPWATFRAAGPVEAAT